MANEHEDDPKPEPQPEPEPEPRTEETWKPMISELTEKVSTLETNTQAQAKELKTLASDNQGLRERLEKLSTRVELKEKPEPKPPSEKSEKQDDPEPDPKPQPEPSKPDPVKNRRRGL